MVIFAEISLILLVALVVVSIMRLLKQPLIIGYILTGFIVGPYILNILQSTEVIELFSKLGITALLFIVGLGLSPKVIKEVGFVALVTGLGQILFTSFIGFGIARLLGFGVVEGLYIAIALTFSSTIIILKLLSDKGDTFKLYGRISIGFLLVQDLVATIALVVVASIASATGDASLVLEVLLLLLKGFVLLVVLFVISIYLLPKVASFFAKSQELLFVFSLAWGMGISVLYYGAGLSIEIGALVAGVTLSMSPYVHEISSRLKPLRDFFIILFFILLGFQLVLDSWQNLLLPGLLFSLIILIGNPLVVTMLMNILGYSRRTGFMAGLTVAQIGEFSLIFAILGHQVGHISTEVLSMITVVSIATIAGSTYLILYSDALYKKIGHLLKYFEIRKIKTELSNPDQDYEAVIFGYRRVGAQFAHALNEIGANFMVIDYNPAVIKHLEAQEFLHEYGDASDVEFLEEIDFENIKILVSTIPDLDTNLLLIETVSRRNDAIVVIAFANDTSEAIALYEAGATHVVLPHYIGAHFVTDMIQKNKLDIKAYFKDMDRHINYLEKIKKLSLEI